jgi:phospholipid/cholesterol/gamma-HCH transport system permease protein
MSTQLPVEHRSLLAPLTNPIAQLGDVSLFGLQTIRGIFDPVAWKTLERVSYDIGVRSMPVVAITGAFIGMVLAVQAYGQFAELGLATRLGGIINISVVRELGPVLAATMLAGRVGSAIAAELATMRVSEQIDALTCLGVNPIHYLAGPRFLACVLLIPLLTVLANFMGVLGGAAICIYIYHVDAHFYWQNTQGAVEMWDLTAGLIKPIFFGAAIAIISCHRGFIGKGGAEGVGKAATAAFVLSFMSILILDFFLALFLNNLHDYLWHTTGGRVV